MKTFDLKSLLLGALLTMSVVVVMLLGTGNNTPVAWEYQVVQAPRGSINFDNGINAAGKDGWEVVGVTVSDADHRLFAVMKRAKAAKRSSWWRFWK